jgi:hypothetical protein
MTPLLLGGGHRRGWFGAQRRRGVQGARPAKCSWAAARGGRASADTGSAHHGLAGTNGAAVDRLAGDRRRTARWHAGARRLLLRLPGSRTGLLLLQARHHIGARRHNRTRGRLSGEIRARLRAQGRSRSRRCQRRRGRRGGHRRRGYWGCGRFARSRRRRSAGHRLSRRGMRCGRHRRSVRWRRQGLPRSRQDLAGARRRNRARGNGTGAQWRMQRRSATAGRQWRPQRRRLAAKRFFRGTIGRAAGGGNGDLLRGPGRCG